MIEATNQMILWAIVIARFLLPIAIPRYPLAAIIGSLALDGVDQTLFQWFTDLPLDGYQGYDKALDIYYLTIAYISTLRNWTNLFAVGLGRFLFFFRLIGVALFELTELRWLLLVFPNTFEYFFILIEALSLRCNPARIDKMKIIEAVAIIWIFVKLPQEYWIHVARMDTTDWIRANPLGIILVFALTALLIIAIWSLLKGESPSILCLYLTVNAIPSSLSGSSRLIATKDLAERYINSALIEKIVLISLVSLIFAQVLPGVQAKSVQIATAVAFLIVINTALSLWLSRRGASWKSTIQEFVVMSGVNLLLLLLFYIFLQHRLSGFIDLETTLFFVLLLTLNVTLYDRYWKIYMLRIERSRRQR